MADLNRREQDIQKAERDLSQVRSDLERAAQDQRKELERVARLTAQEAREALMAQVVDSAKRDSMATVREIEQRAREEGDGPARIEETHQRALAEVDEQIKRAGEEALVEVGITDVHPEMVRVLGRLQYRTSYGQNVLRHLVESAHIGAAIAAEMGLNAKLVKRCALMHDIGKAVTHEAEGSHALI